MHETFFQGQAIWFGVPALLATAVFALKVVLLSLGADHGAGVHDLGDVHAGDLHHHDDSATAFKLLSVQSITAFLMGFGWGGLGALHLTEWPLGGVVLTALASGVAMAWVLGMAMRAMMELQASGNIPIESAVGKEGTVYVGVPGPGGGRGQIKLVVDGRQRIYDAVSGAEELPTGTRVSVLAANGDNTLTVGRA